MHLDVEALQRLLHGEVSAAASENARAHLERCESCTRRYHEVREEEERILAGLRLLDAPAPMVSAAVVRYRARRRFVRHQGWAAAAILLLATGLLYAAPNSPVRTLIERAVHWLQPQQPAEQKSVPAATPRSSIGVSVLPADSFTIAFTATQSVGTIHVAVLNRELLSIASARTAVPIDVEIDRVVVQNRRSTDDFDIIIPQRTPRIVISVKGRTVLTKRDNVIRTRAAALEAGGYRISLKE